MGGHGGTRTETSPTSASIPNELQPLVNKAVAGTTDAMDFTSLRDFLGHEVQGISDLTPAEQQWMSKIFAWASNPDLTQGADQGADYTRRGAATDPWETLGAATDPWETLGAATDPFEQLAGVLMQRGGEMSQGERDAMARLNATDAGSRYSPAGGNDVRVNTDTKQMLRSGELADQLTSGDIGSSPATVQAMKAWEELVRPTVMAGQAITGNLGGGATEEALAHGKTEALTPLLAKEIDTRQAMAQMLGQEGLGISGQQLQAASTTAQLAEQAQEANIRAGLEAAGLDANAAAQLASIAAGAKSRELASGGALGALGGQRAGRKLQAGQARAGRQIQAGGQLAAIGTEKANLQISALAKALETAGMSRDVADKQAAAVYNDFLRRQQMTEQMFLGPTGNYLSGALTPGSLTNTRSTGGGMFGS
jgi:hypothetical protein